MLCLKQSKSLFLLIAASAVLFASPAWPASPAEQTPGLALESKPAESQPAFGTEPDKSKPSTTDRSSTPGQDMPLYKYAVKAVRVCLV